MTDTTWMHIADIQHQIFYVETEDGFRTRVLEAGSGQPTIVLLHGTGGHLETFARNIGPLSRHFRTVAFDLLGHGYTDKPPGPINTWAGLSQHVTQVFDALDISCPMVIGEALGAQIAQWIGLEQSQRLRGLMLCGALIPPYDQTDVSSLGPSKDMHAFEELTRACLAAPTFDLMRRRMQWLFAETSVVPDELVEMRARIWAEPAFRQAHQDLLASYSQSVNRASVTKAQMRAMSVPTVVVWSRTNPFMTLDTVERIISDLPDVRLELFEASKLWPQYEEADRFNSLVLEFAELATR